MTKDKIKRCEISDMIHESTVDDISTIADHIVISSYCYKRAKHSVIIRDMSPGHSYPNKYKFRLCDEHFEILEKERDNGTPLAAVHNIGDRHSITEPYNTGDYNPPRRFTYRKNRL